MTRNKFVLLTVLLIAGTLLLVSQSDLQSQQPPPPEKLAFHDHPPHGPLPPTLDYKNYRDNPAAFVTYKLAAKLANTLYQLPCYCPCRRGLGHQSLLDCYTSKHGERCPTCQREVLFGYFERKKGKSPAQLREDMARGQAAQIDLAKAVDHLYAKMQRSEK
jgi:hypothetical protein